MRYVSARWWVGLILWMTLPACHHGEDAAETVTHTVDEGDGRVTQRTGAQQRLQPANPGENTVPGRQDTARAFVVDTTNRSTNPVGAQGASYLDSTWWTQGMPTGRVSPNPSGRQHTGRAELGKSES